MKYPEIIPNLIGKKEQNSNSGKSFKNLNPHNGETICMVNGSNTADLEQAIATGKVAQKVWAKVPPVARGKVLYQIVTLLDAEKEALANVVAEETGKSPAAALGEVNGAIDLARFYAAEGQRMYGRSTVSGVGGKQIYHIKEPVGLAGLIISANTPIANIAWKVFPALICGNSAIVKASEDAPLTAYYFGKIAAKSDLPDGSLSILQGTGPDIGSPIVRSRDIGVISFTGSTSVGKVIAKEAGERLAKVSLELGGKNPLVVCDDADLDNAVKWILLAGFSNAGQRCAAASRIILFEQIYEELQQRLVQAASSLKLGVDDGDDFGPVVNQKQVDHILGSISAAQSRGARILTGGNRVQSEKHRNGFYIEPTIIENVDPADEFSHTELFGPVITLYKTRDLESAIELANNSKYGLTSAIHTTNFQRAIYFSRSVESGVCNVNGPTYGSEPHLPFGGVKESGNGSREPGTEALDIYSNLKTVSYFL